MSNVEQDRLRQIDNYIEALLPTDEVLQAALENSRRNGLPEINVSANEGRLLNIIARLCGARRILEVGTLGGYSTIWLARALPEGGKLLTLEYSPKHAAVAGENIERAGLSGKVEIRVGAGLELLPEIVANNEGPFDLFFIDADKENYPGYLEWAIKLSRAGSVILSDNLIRGGAVIDPQPSDVSATVVSRYNKDLTSNPRLDTVILPIIRESTDGLGITIVKGFLRPGKVQKCYTARKIIRSLPAATLN